MIEFEKGEANKKAQYVAEERKVNLTHPEPRQMFHRLVERRRSGIYMADTKGYLFYVNYAFVSMLGYNAKEDVLGTNLSDVLFKDQDKREDFLKRLNHMGSVRNYEIEFTGASGIRSVLSIESNFIEDNDGKVIGVDGIMHDVTEKDQLEKSLLSEKQKMEQILEFDETVNAIREYDELVDYVVRRAAQMLEARKCSLMTLDDKNNMLSIAGARGLDQGIIKGVQIRLGEPISGAVAEAGQPLLVKNIEYDQRFQRANKQSYQGRSFMIAPIQSENKLMGVINVSDKITKRSAENGAKLDYEGIFDKTDLRILCAIARKVSVALENVNLYRKLSSLAIIDPMTGLYNYRQFSKSLDYEIKRSRRTGAALSIIMIDIDEFKSYNDTFGHLEGDQLLKDLGKIFKNHLREMDIACRYAGDEFVLIFPDTDIQGVRQVIQKIQDAVKRFSFKRKVTLSFGVAGYNGKSTKYQLILDADKALYRAKQEGKGCIYASA